MAIPVTFTAVELVTAAPIVITIDVEKVFGNTVTRPTGKPRTEGKDEITLIGKFPDGAADSVPV